MKLDWAPASFWYPHTRAGAFPNRRFIARTSINLCMAGHTMLPRDIASPRRITEPFRSLFYLILSRNNWQFCYTNRGANVAGTPIDSDERPPLI